MSTLTRRAWCKLLIGGSAVVAVAACGSSNASTPDAPKGCGLTDATVFIKDNHPHLGHSMTVTSADVLAGIDKTYDIRGMADHTHTVTITADQFAMLAAGGSVMDTTTIAVCHDHLITTSCG